MGLIKVLSLPEMLSSHGQNLDAEIEPPGTSETQHIVLDYVSSLRESLHLASQLARENLMHAQTKMKACYDYKNC